MKKLICVLACVSLCMTGCGTVKLTDREEGIISEYAAYVVLKHNSLYHSRLQEEVYETEPETTVAVQPTEDDAAGKEEAANNMKEEDISTLAEGLGLEGFEVKYTGYDVMDSYADEYFNFSATAGKVLLVMHFDITNSSEQEKEADVLVNQFKFRCTVNSEKRVGAQLTMLVNDLYSFKEILAPQETKEAVLVFQLPEKYENTIEQLTLTVKNEEENHRYNLPVDTYKASTTEQETTAAPETQKVQ